MAHGTARTEMLDLLGIGETAKASCDVHRVEPSDAAYRLLKRLGRELEMRYPGTRNRVYHSD